MRKVRPNTRVYQRYYLLDAGLQALCWEPSKKESDKARISLASIREVGAQRKTLTRPCWCERSATADWVLLCFVVGADGSQHGNLPDQWSLRSDFRGLCVLHRLWRHV